MSPPFLSSIHIANSLVPAHATCRRTCWVPVFDPPFSNRTLSLIFSLPVQRCFLTPNASLLVVVHAFVFLVPVAQAGAILHRTFHRVHALEANGLLPERAADHLQGGVDQGQDHGQTERQGERGLRARPGIAKGVREWNVRGPVILIACCRPREPPAAAPPNVRTLEAGVCARAARRSVVNPHRACTL